jgi:hypothetical protein
MKMNRIPDHVCLHARRDHSPGQVFVRSHHDNPDRALGAVTVSHLIPKSVAEKSRPDIKVLEIASVVGRREPNHLAEES